MIPLLLAAASNFGFQEVGAIITIIGAVAAVVYAWRKFAPEKNALYITSIQGAAVIMNNLVKTLREEVDRQRATIAMQEAHISSLERENEALRKEKNARDTAR